MTEMQDAEFGMSDMELESACIEDSVGVSPWAYWTSEHYGFGKCIRIFARYPKALPLYVYSDHGVGLESSLYPHELGNSSRTMLTWHPQKAKRYSDLETKVVVRVPHPWIHYRRLRRIERLGRTKGTIVFFTHSTPGFKWENRDSAEYFEKLRALPEKFQPIVVCLHMHDINAGFHKTLRNVGFPIVTAGNTSSSQFVDRFYELVRGFSYSTSQNWGSHIAYCVELGLPHFFLGNPPKLVNLSHEELPIGDVPYLDEDHEEYEERAHAIFDMPVDAVTQPQKEFVEALLGLDSSISRTQLSWILWREFFRNWKSWWSVIGEPIRRSVRKRGLFGFLGAVRNRIKNN